MQCLDSVHRIVTKAVHGHCFWLTLFIVATVQAQYDDQKSQYDQQYSDQQYEDQQSNYDYQTVQQTHDSRYSSLHLEGGQGCHSVGFNQRYSVSFLVDFIVLNPSCNKRQWKMLVCIHFSEFKCTKELFSPSHPGCNPEKVKHV